MDAALIEKLKKLAGRDCWDERDDFNPCDLSGGNYDDAYYGGVEDGKADIAREVLDEIGEGW